LEVLAVATVGSANFAGNFWLTRATGEIGEDGTVSIVVRNAGEHFCRIIACKVIAEGVVVTHRCARCHKGEPKGKQKLVKALKY